MSACCPFTEEGLQYRESFIWVTQLQTEQHREHSTHDGPHDTGYQELLTNGFVILAENVLSNECLFVVMHVMFVMMNFM